MGKLSLACVAVLLCFGPADFAQQGGEEVVPATQAPPPGPVLSIRPAPKPVKKPDTSIKLDVVVTDGSGKPVTGLEPWDFKVTDNDQPRKILSFHSYDGLNVRPDLPVEVILVMDTANLQFQQVAFVRKEVGAFLRKNGGHLAQPVSLILLTDLELRMQPRPSTDGNAVASVLDQIKGRVSHITPAMGGEGALERFQLSARQMGNIAENEARKPGRKLLIWIGPGWPLVTRTELGYYSAREQRRYFDGIVQLSTKLREARMVVYSVAPANIGAGGGNSLNTLRYKDFLKGVKSASEADSGNLSLKVLVTQTGGQILGPDNDVSGQIDRCIADADLFYRISFDPHLAGHADEYHELNVAVDKPGLTVRTNTGYYGQP